MNKPNTMKEVQDAVKKVLNKKPPRKKAQKEIFVVENKMKKKPMRKSKTKLTDRQEKALKKHSVHHTKKHMAMMRKEMLAGSTFSSAHKKAMEAVGK